MAFIVAGGRPDYPKERFMIKDNLGYVMTTESYIKENRELFRYVGYSQANSTTIHTYEFIE